MAMNNKLPETVEEVVGCVSIVSELRMSVRETGKHIVRACNRAEDPALNLHHPHGRAAQLLTDRARRVLDEQTLIRAVVALPDGRMHTHIRRDAADDELGDAAHLEEELKVRVRERGAAGLVDDGLVRGGVELGDDIVPRLAADEEPAQGATIADAEARRVIPGAEELARRERRQIRAVALAGVVDGVSGGTEGGEEAGDVGDGGARVRDGVSEVGDVPAL